MGEKLKIYFMGAGPIAVPVLRKLAGSDAVDLVGVCTQPDRSAGRGGRLTPTPVGGAAAELGLAVDKVDSVNTAEFLAYLESLAPQMIVVISFGQILREGVLALPPAGCVNVHASLLPKYRGASPVVSAIRHLDERTGVAFMRMERGLDTGPVYHTETVALVRTERADRLELHLGDVAAAAAIPVLRKIAAGSLQAVPQQHALATVCKKICKADGAIDWRKPAQEIEAMTRAFAPWPGAYFTLTSPGRSFPVTVSSARVQLDRCCVPGEILQCDKRGWIIGCGRGALELLTVSAPGKREMAATAFLNGLRGAELSIPEVTVIQ